MSGEYYRVAGPRHTTAKDIVSGIGAYRAGGRWNPLKIMKVVYLSREPETALREANEHFRYYRLPISKSFPKVVVAIRIELESILNLTRPAIAKTLPEPMKTLLAEDWRAIMARKEEALTQAIGRVAFEAGFQGLLVPSKLDKRGVNLLVFPERLTNKSTMEVINARELDKLGKPSYDGLHAKLHATILRESAMSGASDVHKPATRVKGCGHQEKNAAHGAEVWKN